MEAGRPRLPDRHEYNLEPDTPVPWDEGEQSLISERYFWIVTTRSGGRPHAIPIWAVWLNETLWFASSPETVSAKNLATTPWALVHVPSGRNPIVIEGTTERLPPTAAPEV